MVSDENRYRQTLATVARRGRSGDDVHLAVREFLDEYPQRPVELRIAAIEDRPEPCGDLRWDAYLGALGEHLALRADLPVPSWTLDPCRFLAQFWFVSEVPGFRAISIAQAPVSFKRRGVMVPERSLVRV